MVEIILWIGAVVGLATGAARWRGAELALRAPRGASSAARGVAAATDFDRDSLARAVDLIADGNLFRPERHAADPQAQDAPEVDRLSPPAHPSLILRGIAGGPPWSVVLEGLPGRAGAIVLRQGDTLDGLSIRAVRRDTVVVRGRDTTWRLTMRTP